VRRRFLLDTQAFVVSILDTDGLSPKARALLLRSDTDPFLSLVSLWEMQIKVGLKKLGLPVPLSEAVQRAVTEMRLELLPLQLEHIYRLADLPLHHRDPFDRLLIAQALQERMPIISGDADFDAYGVERIW
jgi:PIN domain nuclease of toxin-antitoxin system